MCHLIFTQYHNNNETQVLTVFNDSDYFRSLLTVIPITVFYFQSLNTLDHDFTENTLFTVLYKFFSRESILKNGSQQSEFTVWFTGKMFPRLSIYSVSSGCNSSNFKRSSLKVMNRRIFGALTRRSVSGRNAVCYLEIGQLR